MRRMISDVMQRQIKNLFESVQTDANGNVEITKNLTVDGKLSLKQNFRHTVVIKMYGGLKKDIGCISFTDYSDSGTPITDYDKLHATFGGKIISISGHVSQYANNTYTTVFPCTLDLTGGTMATDAVNVITAITNQYFPMKLSELGAQSMTIEDTVSAM